MSSLDYVAIPAGATRLQGKQGTSPAKQILTALPKTSDSSVNASVPSSPTSSITSFGGNLNSFTSPTNAAFSMLPQLLFSSAIPTANASADSTRNRRASVSQDHRPLLTARDSLSLPITSNNFKRFVARAGPLFWLQDRIEEVITWKHPKGNSVTAAWLAAYAFLCYFPKMFFFVPHAALISILLATYQYPALPSNNDPLASSKPSTTPEPTPGGLGSNFVDWQANLQGIQNLMGAVSDTYDLLQPHTQHLILSPAHLARTPPASSGSGAPAHKPISPYPPYILLILLLTSPPLLLLLSSPFFPARLVTFIAGALPVLALHPRVGPVLAHLAEMGQRIYTCLSGQREVVEDDKEVLLLLQLAHDAMGMALLAKQRLLVYARKSYRAFLTFRRLLAKFGLGVAYTSISSSFSSSDVTPSSSSSLDADEPSENVADLKLATLPVQSLIERFVDDDRLDDRVWNSELREVEIWENERFVPAGGIDQTKKRRPSSLSPRLSLSYFPDGDLDPDSTNEIPLSDTTSSVNTSEDLGELGPGTWSKTHLRPTERKAWTRGRDGWGGVRARVRSTEKGEKEKEKKEEKKDKSSSGSDDEKEGGEEGGKGVGYVSSNLTFSLSPGWSFVRTEGWRKDRVAEWAGEASYNNISDTSGWVYTNDVWGGPLRKVPVWGSVTRRRRWTRRVWFNGEGGEGGIGKSK